MANITKLKEWMIQKNIFETSTELTTTDSICFFIEENGFKIYVEWFIDEEEFVLNISKDEKQIESYSSFEIVDIINKINETIK